MSKIWVHQFYIVLLCKSATAEQNLKKIKIGFQTLDLFSNAPSFMELISFECLLKCMKQKSIKSSTKYFFNIDWWFTCFLNNRDCCLLFRKLAINEAILPYFLRSFLEYDVNIHTSQLYIHFKV